MTLVVSLRVPDGIVLAADSLQTTQGQLIQAIKDFKYKKPDTGEEIIIPDLQLPPIIMPTSVSSYALKLFPFKKNFGVATFGSAILNDRTIYNHIKNIETISGDNVKSVTEVANLIKEYFVKQLEEDIRKTKKIIPENSYILGFQVSGFESKDDVIGRTIEVIIGKPEAIASIYVRPNDS